MAIVKKKRQNAFVMKTIVDLLVTFPHAQIIVKVHLTVLERNLVLTNSGFVTEKRKNVNVTLAG